MNFEFSEEQDLLREQAQRMLAQQCPLEKVRQVLDNDDVAYDSELWQTMAELGWTAVGIPEQYGGVGLGYLELCVIAEELGRSLAPTPYASSVYLATEALLQFGSEEQKESWLPQLAEGKVIGTLALAEGRGTSKDKQSACRQSGSEISGCKWPVPDGDVADLAIVSAAGEHGQVPVSR